MLVHRIVTSPASPGKGKIQGEEKSSKQPQNEKSISGENSLMFNVSVKRGSFLASGMTAAGTLLGINMFSTVDSLGSMFASNKSAEKTK